MGRGPLGTLPSLIFLLKLARCQHQIGTPQWGFDLIIPQQMQQCVPYRIFYNITDVHQPSRTYPGSGAVSFLTPDTSAQEWMVLTPPMGAGYLSWTPTLAAGKAFAISVPGLSGYSEVFTIQSGPASCLPAAGAAQTMTSTYGSLNVPVYHEMATQSVAVSGAGDTPFHGVDYPAGSFSTVSVPLGVLIAAQSTGASTPLTTSGHAASSSQGSNNLPSQTQTPGASSSSSPTSASAALASSSIVSNGAVSSGDATTSDRQTSGTQSSGGATSVVTISTSARVPAGAIAGGVIGALLLGLLVGVLVMLVRRRRALRQPRAPRVVTAPTPVWLPPTPYRVLLPVASVSDYPPSSTAPGTEKGATLRLDTMYNPTSADKPSSLGRPWDIMLPADEPSMPTSPPPPTYTRFNPSVHG